ncbi:hypothetical protein KTS45_19370 [Halomicroarcula limicola]|uniref:Uncharacterized protein n=1 Tax=Haloarcula limicola TaxID=1429915 RepID=A0A8J7Y8S2_9EURY|nr:hypothetical protein [Halomicroarcula limicola]MBV0926372.1 hypothetical protein [Halomicroarcula limicola]
MSERVAFYPPEAQKEMIERMADRQGMTVSEYCVAALDTQVARDIRSERVAETALERQLDEMQQALQDEIASALSPSTDDSELHGVALWNLLGTERPSDAQADALEEASTRLETGVEKLRQQEEDA